MGSQEENLKPNIKSKKNIKLCPKVEYDLQDTLGRKLSRCGSVKASKSHRNRWPTQRSTNRSSSRKNIGFSKPSKQLVLLKVIEL